MAENKSTQMTGFQMVGEFHEVFEHPKNTKPDTEVFDKNEKLVNLRLGLIEEEFNELKQAIKDKNMVEVADALSDILYVVYGAGQAFGINLDDTFDLVHKSNMTKACKNEQEAIDTIEYIKNEGRYKNPQYKQSKNGKYWIVYDGDTGKTLKSKYYNPVDLSYITK
jgi:predicted HAD superfamily Cof-like phosphohydrolase